jgi:MFS family permease
VGSSDLRRYLVGLAASLIGTSAMTLVAGIWVKSLSGSSRAAALVSVCLFAPSLVAPIAGWLADRFRRRSLLLATNVAGALIVLPLLAVRTRSDSWLIFVVMGAYGFVLVLVDPAETALFTVVVPGPERGRVNGIRLSLQEGAKLLAPLAGAGLFAVAGGGPVALVDAGTFAVAAAAVGSMTTREPPPPRTRLAWRAEFGAGLAHVRRTPQLRRLATVGALAMAISGLAVAAQYALLDELGRSAAFLGVLTSLLGAGSIAAGLLCGRILRRRDESRLALYGVGCGVAGYGLIATGWLPAVLAGWVIRGFSLPWIVIAVITAAQQLTPDALQGRVAATVTLLLFAAQPVTQAAGAALLGPLNFRAVYLTVCALTAALAFGLWTPAHRPHPAADARGSTGSPLA